MKKTTTINANTRTNKRRAVAIALLLGVVILSIVVFMSARMVAQQNTAPTAVQADASITPDVNASFQDNFSGEQVDQGKWTTSKNSDSVNFATTKDELTILLPATTGAAGRAATNGSLTLKQAIEAKSDFRMSLTMRKPTIKGAGQAMSGIAFASQGSENQEVARLFWRVDGAVSELVFVTRGADGKMVETNKVAIEAAKATLRLVRAGQSYVAYYSIGLDDDRNTVKVGQANDTTLGANGRMRIFTSSTNKDGKHPEVLSKVDAAAINWKNPDVATKSVIRDTFGGGQEIDQNKWIVTTQAGATVTQNANDNLIMRITAGANNGKAKLVNMVTRDIIDQKQNFTTTVQMLKPIVEGEGMGRSGLQFLTNGQESDESGTIAWRVTATTSKLVFTVVSADGKVVANEEIDLGKDVNRVSLRMAKNQNGYIAMYKPGLTDGDTPWQRFSNRVTVKDSGKGRMRLFTSNGGEKGAYPAVRGRFDFFSLTY